MVGGEAGATGAAAAASSERRRCGTGRRDGEVEGSTRERAASHSSGDGGGSTGVMGVSDVAGDIGKADVGGAAGASCAEWRDPGAPSSCRAIELQSCGRSFRSSRTGGGVNPRGG